MSDISLLKRMFEQNFKLNEPIDTTLKPYEACYFNGTVWTNATALIPPTGFLAEKLVDDIGNIALGSEVPVETLSNTALSVPVVSNAIYCYDPATRLLNTVGTGYKIGTGYTGSGSSSQYGSIIVNLNQSSGGGGSGTVTNVSSANSDIAVVNGSVAPVLTFDRGTTVTESGFTSVSEFFTYVAGVARRITVTDLRDWYAEPSTGGTSTMRATTAESIAWVIDNRFVTPLGAAAAVDTVYWPTITETGITIASELPIREAGTKRRINLKDVKDFYTEPSSGGSATMRATAAETTAGTLDNVFVTPLGLQNKINAIPPTTPAFNGVSCYAAASVNYTTTDTAVPFTTEEYDTNSYHDNSTNTSRFTAPSTGYYSFSWKRTDDLFSGSGVQTQMKVKKNWSTFLTGTDETYYVGTSAGYQDSYPIYSELKVLLTAGDYLELFAFATANSTVAYSNVRVQMQNLGA